MKMSIPTFILGIYLICVYCIYRLAYIYGYISQTFILNIYFENKPYFRISSLDLIYIMLFFTQYFAYFLHDHWKLLLCWAVAC